MSYQKLQKLRAPLVIYIEGDGRAVNLAGQVSSNPTPSNPIALKLAALDLQPNVAYLARPCQYRALDLEPACQKEIWSQSRFSEEVIHSMNEAIDQLKVSSKAKEIHLVGFSGGAAVAALIAARRNDIATLRTVAGDLDHTSLSQYHHTPSLERSLNPMAFAEKLSTLPQHHFVGDKDIIVPPFIAENFVNKVNAKGGNCAKITILKNVTHHKGWEEVDLGSGLTKR